MIGNDDFRQERPKNTRPPNMVSDFFPILMNNHLFWQDTILPTFLPKRIVIIDALFWGKKGRKTASHPTWLLISVILRITICSDRISEPFTQWITSKHKANSKCYKVINIITSLLHALCCFSLQKMVDCVEALRFPRISAHPALHRIHHREPIPPNECLNSNGHVTWHEWLYNHVNEI